MNGQRAVAWALSLILIGMVGLFTLRLESGALWKVPVEVTRMPCSLKPGDALEFFFPVLQPGLAGLGLEHLPSRRIPSVRMEVATVPDGTVIARSRMVSRRGELVGMMPVRPVAPHQTLRARLEMAASGPGVMLHCVSTAGPGEQRERPVVHTFHRLNDSGAEAFVAWMRVRVGPLLPAGALTLMGFVFLAATLVGAATVAAVAMHRHPVSGDAGERDVP